MSTAFENIILMGQHATRSHEITDTILRIYNYLKSKNIDTYLEEETANNFNELPCQIMRHKDMHKADLLIVVGGDGNILQASKLAVPNGIPVLGINRGRLGFLADVKPSDLEITLEQVLARKYSMEQRFLLEAEIQDASGTTLRESLLALNDVVLLPNELAAHMIAFSIHINGELVCAQRADGLIASTPTGSTAYSLSGGGPILHPNLDAISLLPMFPHTLSARPIVIPGNLTITIVIDQDNLASPRLSCDGQRRILIEPQQRIVIKKHPQHLTILHPLNYNYYQTLRAKLGWK